MKRARPIRFIHHVSEAAAVARKGEIGGAIAQKAVLKITVNNEEKYFGREKRMDVEFLL